MYQKINYNHFLIISRNNIKQIEKKSKLSFYFEIILSFKQILFNFIQLESKI
jgi:hypothetical protein